MQVLELYEEVFEEPAQQGPPQVRVTNGWVSVGNALLDRRSPKMGQGLWTGDWQSLRLLNVQATSLEALTKCLENKLAALLVGPSGTGKTAMVQILAKLAGRSLAVLPLGAATDALELLGNFEQVWKSRFSCRVDGDCLVGPVGLPTGHHRVVSLQGELVSWTSRGEGEEPRLLPLQGVQGVGWGLDGGRQTSGVGVQH